MATYSYLSSKEHKFVSRKFKVERYELEDSWQFRFDYNTLSMPVVDEVQSQITRLHPQSTKFTMVISKSLDQLVLPDFTFIDSNYNSLFGFEQTLRLKIIMGLVSSMNDSIKSENMTYEISPTGNPFEVSFGIELHKGVSYSGVLIAGRTFIIAFSDNDISEDEKWVRLAHTLNALYIYFTRKLKGEA